MYTRKTGSNKGILVIHLENPVEWPDALVLATGDDSPRYNLDAWACELARLEEDGEIEISSRLTATGRPVHIEKVY